MALIGKPGRVPAAGPAMAADSTAAPH
jgi:hypothetical protein